MYNIIHFAIEKCRSETTALKGVTATQANACSILVGSASAPATNAIRGIIGIPTRGAVEERACLTMPVQVANARPMDIVWHLTSLSAPITLLLPHRLALTQGRRVHGQAAPTL